MQGKALFSLLFFLFFPLFPQDRGFANIVVGKVFVKKSKTLP